MWKQYSHNPNVHIFLITIYSNHQKYHMKYLFKQIAKKKKNAFREHESVCTSGLDQTSKLGDLQAYYKQK